MKSAEEIYKLLTSHKTNYVIIEEAICNELRINKGCRIKDLLDVANGHVSWKLSSTSNAFHLHVYLKLFTDISRSLLLTGQLRSDTLVKAILTGDFIEDRWQFKEDWWMVWLWERLYFFTHTTEHFLLLIFFILLCLAGCVWQRRDVLFFQVRKILSGDQVKLFSLQKLLH